MMDPRYSLKVEQAERFAGGLYMKGEGKRGVENDSKLLTWEDAVSTPGMEKMRVE